MARLKQFYTEKLRPSLMQKFNYSNILQTPKLEKIVVNIGVGEATSTEFVHMFKITRSHFFGIQNIAKKIYI